MANRSPYRPTHQAHLNNALADARKLIQSLIDNRKKAWQTANFNVQSKLKALSTFERRFEAAEKWGRDGHYHLFYNNAHLIREILPGQYSRNQKLREKVITFLENVEKYYEKHYVS